MTVKELVYELQKLDQSLQVEVDDYLTNCGELSYTPITGLRVLCEDSPEAFVALLINNPIN